jgi:hypothetical protein
MIKWSSDHTYWFNVSVILICYKDNSITKRQMYDIIRTFLSLVARSTFDVFVRIIVCWIISSCYLVPIRCNIQWSIHVDDTLNNIYVISLWIQKVKEWLVFLLLSLFSFVLPIGLEKKWRFMLNYNIGFVLAYYHKLLHPFTN